MDTSSGTPKQSMPQEIVDNIIAHTPEDHMLTMLITYHLVSKRAKQEADEVFIHKATIHFTTPLVFKVDGDTPDEELYYKLSCVGVHTENNKRIAVFRDDDILKNVVGLYNNGQHFSQVNVGERHNVNIEGLGPQDALLKAWKRTVCPHYLISRTSNLETVRLSGPKRAKVEIGNQAVLFGEGWELKLKEAQCALGNVQLSVPVHDFFSTVIKGYKERRSNETAQERIRHRSPWGWWSRNPH